MCLCEYMCKKGRGEGKREGEGERKRGEGYNMLCKVFGQ